MISIKKITGMALATLSVLGLSFAMQQPTNAHAAKYVWTKTKSYQATTPAYHAKVQGQSAYLWNWNHTKKLHNSKNYPHTTWYVQQSVAMKHGKKTTIYYQVVSGNKKVTGYIYRGYLTKGKYKAPSNNNSSNSNNNNNEKPPYLRSSYISTILDVFKGTKFNDEMAQKSFNYNSENPDSDIDNLMKKDTTIVIRNSTTLDDYNPEIHKLRTHQITFKQFLLNDLKAQNINPNNYAGYNIVANGYIDGTADETTDVGQYYVMLYK